VLIIGDDKNGQKKTTKKMDYYGVEDVPEAGTDLLISLLVGVFSVLTILVLVFLIRWGLKK